MIFNSPLTVVLVPDILLVTHIEFYQTLYRCYCILVPDVLSVTYRHFTRLFADITDCVLDSKDDINTTNEFLFKGSRFSVAELHSTSQKILQTHTTTTPDHRHVPLRPSRMGMLRTSRP